MIRVFATATFLAASALFWSSAQGFQGVPPGGLDRFNFEVIGAFSPMELDRIAEATQVVNRRFFAEDVFRRAEQGKPCVTQKALALAVLEKSRHKYQPAQEEMLYIEMLNLLNNPRYRHLRFKVVIRSFFEDNDKLAQAPLDSIQIDPVGTGESYIRGAFDISLNRSWILEYGTEYDWAGVIAHEILHNLGHCHPDSSGVWQIDRFQDAIAQTPLPKRGVVSSELALCAIYREQ